MRRGSFRARTPRSREASGHHRTGRNRRVQTLLVDEISKKVERYVGFRDDGTVEHRRIKYRFQINDVQSHRKSPDSDSPRI
jgi:hypothetical protein